MKTDDTRSPYAWVAVLAVAACVGCTPQPVDSGPSPSTTGAPYRTSTPTARPTPTPTQTDDPETAAAKEAILESYEGFWAAQVDALSDPSLEPPPELAVYAIDKAFSGVGEALFAFREQGIVMVGAPVLDPVVQAVDLGDSPSGHLIDCVDSSDWTPIFRESGEPAAAPNQAPRLVVESWATVYAGRWTIRETLIHRDQTC